MDFLDPKKQRQHTILLYAGYFLITLAIVISTVVLVYQANGFGVNSKGQVVQNGLVFFSSQPSPADIYLNGHKNQNQTNNRLSLAAGQYNVRLSRDGYRDWRRTITVQGGDVQHFDYPFLFPKTLTTKTQTAYKNGTGLVSQSRDLRWLAVQSTPGAAAFDIYDLKGDDTPATPLALTAAVVKGSLSGTQAWSAVQWADDNVHLIVRHDFPGGSEYIELDRTDPAKAVNLTQLFGTTPTSLALIDNKYDQFSLLSAVGGDLSTASLTNPAPVKVLSKVYNYKTYGAKDILYATAQNAPAGKAVVALYDGTDSHVIRDVSANTTYLLDMAGYRGKPYVVLGASSENVVYIYQDPMGQLQDQSVTQPTAIRAIKVINPNYVAFSPNTQYIMAENANQFAVYDIYLKHSYAYLVHAQFDSPQPHATWMDGNRLTYVSAAKTTVLDYDHRNVQTLMPASASYPAFFSPNYHYAYTMAPTTDGGLALTQTALLTSNDL